MRHLEHGYHGAVVCPRGKGNPRNNPDTLLQLQDGSLLLAYSRKKGREDEARSEVAGTISTDGGFTWGSPFTVFPDEAQMGTNSAGWLRLRSGSVGVVVTYTHDFDDLKSYLRTSEDDGKTFGDPVLITPRPGYNCPTNGRLVQLDDGRLICPIHHAERSRVPDENYRVLVYFSDDEGETWQESNELRLPKRGAMEPTIAEIEDGRCMMLIRTQLGCQYQSFSDDGGETWVQPGPSALVSGEAEAYLTRIPSTGDLLACWNYDFKPHWTRRHYGLRCPLTVAISKDGGETWENIKDLEDDHRYSFGNPAITFVDDRAYIVYYMGHGIDEWGAWDVKLTIVPERFFYSDQVLNRAVREMSDQLPTPA